MNLSDCQWILMPLNESNEMLLNLISGAIDSFRISGNPAGSQWMLSDLIEPSLP